MVISFLTFYLPPLYPLAPNLGIFWLFLMGIAFLGNALWWTPELFIIGGLVQIAAGALPLLVPSLLFYQYLIAAIAGNGGDAHPATKSPLQVIRGSDAPGGAVQTIPRRVAVAPLR
jgi:hypothetical protein